MGNTHPIIEYKERKSRQSRIKHAKQHTTREASNARELMAQEDVPPGAIHSGQFTIQRFDLARGYQVGLKNGKPGKQL